MIISGIKPVMEAINGKKRKISRVYLSNSLKPSKAVYLKNFLTANRIIFEGVEKEILDELAGHNFHKGICALTDEFVYTSEDKLLSVAKEKKMPIVICDGIKDAGNLGSIIRTSEAAGAAGLVIAKDKAVGVTETVVRISCGATELFPIARVTNLVSFFERLKKENFWIYGFDLSSSIPYYKQNFKNMNIALVFGEEESGMRPLVKKNCDMLLKIPMRGKINSLNVGVSAGIALFHILYQNN